MAGSGLSRSCRCLQPDCRSSDTDCEGFSLSFYRCAGGAPHLDVDITQASGVSEHVASGPHAGSLTKRELTSDDCAASVDGETDALTGDNRAELSCSERLENRLAVDVRDEITTAKIGRCRRSAGSNDSDFRRSGRFPPR